MSSSLYCESQFSTLGDTLASGTDRSGCGMAPVALVSSVAVTTLILDNGSSLCCVAETVKIARSDRLRSTRCMPSDVRFIFTTRLASFFTRVLNEELHAAVVYKNHCGR